MVDLLRLPKDAPNRQKLMEAAARHCYDKTQFQVYFFTITGGSSIKKIWKYTLISVSWSPFTYILYFISNFEQLKWMVIIERFLSAFLWITVLKLFMNYFICFPIKDNFIHSWKLDCLQYLNNYFKDFLTII